MLLLIFEFLSDVLSVKIPSAFFYTSTRMLLAALCGFIFTLFLAPPFIRKLYELKIGQPIRKDECPPLAELHKDKEHTPTMGGVLILSGLFLSMLLWMQVTHIFTWILGLTVIWLGATGGFDDYLKLKHHSAKGLSGRMKLLLQVGLSGIICAYLFIPGIAEWIGSHTFIQAPAVKELYLSKKFEALSPIGISEFAGKLFLPFYKYPMVTFSGIGLLLGALFAVFVIVGSSNSVNLTDGLDGLATGCILIATLPLIVIAFLSNHAQLAGYLNLLYIEGAAEVAVCLSALFGACLGFLWYNGHPAQVFMGDTGSLAMGGLIGVSAVLLRREFLLGIVGAIFVAEALSVIIQVLSYRYRNKKRVFLCAPLHHHFEYKGVPETKVVMRFWIMALLFAALGILSLKIQ